MESSEHNIVRFLHNSLTIFIVVVVIQVPPFHQKHILSLKNPYSKNNSFNNKICIIHKLSPFPKE